MRWYCGPLETRTVTLPDGARRSRALRAGEMDGTPAASRSCYYGVRAGACPPLVPRLKAAGRNAMKPMQLCLAPAATLAALLVVTPASAQGGKSVERLYI